MQTGSAIGGGLLFLLAMLVWGQSRNFWVGKLLAVVFFTGACVLGAVTFKNPKVVGNGSEIPGTNILSGVR
ncbi:MAG TPA: hypothetical protein VI981_02230 [Candidatus Paceibacterota bacterium]